MTMNNSFIFRCRWISVFFLLMLFLSPSFAQKAISDSFQEEISDTLYQAKDVTVVGTRAEERIIDIPYSVFRVDRKELPYGKKISARDVLADVPGLFLQSLFGNHDLRISLRGFGTRSTSGVRGVRVLQEGFPQSEPDGETILDDIDFTSLGGVEVVKGNLSALYANAPGGVINFSPELYFPHNYVGLISQAGRYGWLLNGVKLGLQNPSNRLLFSYNYSNLDGFRDHGPEYQHLANAIYEAYPGRRATSLTILGAYLNQFSRQPGFLTREEFEADPFQADALAVSQDFRRHTRKGRLGIRFKTRFDEDRQELEITGYGSIKELERTDNLTYRLASRYSLGALLRFTNRSHILDGRENTLTVGMDYAYQAGPVTEFENVNGNRGISVESEFRESLNNVGFYALDRFEALPERLNVLLLGRLERNSFQRDIRIPFGFTDSTVAFQRFSPKAGLNYKLKPSIALYTSYGLSYDFPALSELANTPLSSDISYTINPDLKPQESYNFEAGIKGNIVNPGAVFMPKYQFDITYFNYHIRDEIIPFVINQQTYYRNTARTNRQGLEIGFKSHPVEAVELAINYVYMHFQFDRYLATIYAPSGTTEENYTGNTVPSIPKHIVNFILNYELEFSEDLSALLQWDSDYIGDMYVDDANSELSRGYFYGNVMAGLNFKIHKTSAIAYFAANNIFDKRYAGFININDFSRHFYGTGEPRMFSLGLRLKYQL